MNATLIRVLQTHYLYSSTYVSHSYVTSIHNIIIHEHVPPFRVIPSDIYVDHGSSVCRNLSGKLFC